MKLLPPPTNFNFSNFRFIYFLIFVLFSCNKVDVSIDKNNKTETVISEKTYGAFEIEDWLKQKIQSSELNNKPFIENLISNLQLDGLVTKDLKYNASLAIVPLKSNYFSRNIKNINEKPYQYLVAKLYKGKISNADLVLIYPDEKNKISNKTNGTDSSGFTPEELWYIYRSNYFPEDGLIQLVDLNDTLYHQASYLNTISVEASDLQNRTAPPPEGSGGTETCTAYFWVTTFYWPDGTTTETSDYLYTLCSTSPGSGGGGGSSGSGNPPNNVPEIPTLMEASVFVFEGRSGGQMGFTANVGFSLVGQKYLNPNENIFTSYENLGGAIIYTPGFHLPGTPMAIIPGVLTQNANFEQNNQVARCSFNWPISFNSPAVPPIPGFGNTNYFTARVVFQ